jgi:hypothetical protein
MPTNVYVNNFSNQNEQSLIEDLIIESIKFYGTDIYWLPRTLVEQDAVYGEDRLSRFNSAIGFEVYIKNVEGFEGEGDFLSRFGLEIRDQITFTTSIRRFRQVAGPRDYSTDKIRPNEGDLIWFPLAREGTGHMFEIKFVEHEAMFYPLGTLPVYDLRCESFVYSNEVIATGIKDIDHLYNITAQDYLVPEGTTTTELPSGPGDDNVDIQNEANTILDTSSNPFGDF